MERGYGIGKQLGNSGTAGTPPPPPPKQEEKPAKKPETVGDLIRKRNKALDDIMEQSK